MNDKKVDELSSRSEILECAQPPEHKDDTISQLEGQLEDIKNKFYRERFMWVISCVVRADAIMFMVMGNWSGPIVIGTFELIGIYILADHLKIATVAPLIDRLTGFFHRTAKTEKD